MNELYKISGRVMQGERRGKLMGFPTANIRLHKVIPEGIYAASVTINGKKYCAATFVGSAKTFKHSQVKVESYIFDFSSDLYGKWITVRLFKKIRDNQKFDSVDELVKQMRDDIENIKVFFTKEV